MRKTVKRAKTAYLIVKDSGPLALWHRTKAFTKKRLNGPSKITLSVAEEDILAADWARPIQKAKDRKKGSGPLTINWVLPPAGPGSGGHNTIFRFVRHLEEKGHTCRLYFYDPLKGQTISEQAEILKVHFKPMNASIHPYEKNMLPADAVIATSWQTAYPVFLDSNATKKFYFVQDYEPYFYPVGSESVLAENTYRFNLFGITAGNWLATKLSTDFGMSCDHFDFGSDSSVYTFRNKGKRKKIVFYARPVTARRGFELGVYALTLFNLKHPDYEINMVGWDVSDYKLPFEFVNHGILSHDKLAELYNECAASLVMSLTNMSLLPLELLSAGCIPVVNDSPNNRLVSNNPFIKYSPLSPHALAESLSEVITKPDITKYAEEASRSVKELDWRASGEKVEGILIRELR